MPAGRDFKFEGNFSCKSEIERKDWNVSKICRMSGGKKHQDSYSESFDQQNHEVTFFCTHSVLRSGPGVNKVNLFRPIDNKASDCKCSAFKSTH